MKHIVLISIISAAFVFEYATAACPAKPKITSPSQWKPSANCPKGPRYTDPSNGYNCHCWCHKGYICDPPTGTVKSTTKAASGKCRNRQPPVPAKSKWVESDNCPKGGVYKEPGYKCHCWCHRGYICDPVATSATTKRPVTTKPPATTQEPCRNRQPPVPPGSKWVANPNCPVGPTYNDPGNGGKPYHCHCWCHKGYICDPKPTKATTAASTTGGATGSTAAVTTGGTTGSTAAVTTGGMTGSTAAVTTGSTAAATTGSTAAVTTGSTAAATTGSTAAVTTGSTAAVTTGSTAAVTTAAVTTAGVTTAAVTTAAVTTAAVTTVAPTTAVVG